MKNNKNKFIKILCQIQNEYKKKQKSNIYYIIVNNLFKKIVCRKNAKQQK